MKLVQATRQQSRMRLGIQGPSGSGKTIGALQVAYGLCGNWTKIALLDTEYGSGNLYSHLGPYNTVMLGQPFTPEKYIEAIQLCEHSGMEVIILDSVSHEWEYLLDYHGSLPGNSFTNWNKITPRHNAFISAILQSPCHVIATTRSKSDYVLTDKNGKMVPEKVGMKPIQRDGLEYEFTVVFDLDIKHNATASKDRTSLFSGKPEFKLTDAVGQQLLKWCKTGAIVDPAAELTRVIENAQTVEDLIDLYNLNPDWQDQLQDVFTNRRKELQKNTFRVNNLQTPKFSTNGQH